MSHAAPVVHDHGNDAWEAVLTRIQRPALIVGAVGLLITLVGLVFHPEAALKSYLWAFLYWAAIPLGSLAFLMIQHMTGGTWGLVIRRVLEASASMIVLTAVFCLPLLIAVAMGYYKLYPWLSADAEGHKVVGHAANPDHLWFKDFWLSPTFFIVRTIGYFVIWSFLALYLYGWSGREDRVGSTPQTRFRARQIAAPGILLGSLAINFAMIDWVMTLDPSWYSTMFGVLYLIGCGLVAMAFAIIILRLISDRRPIRDLLTPGTLNDLGNLMFAFTLLWAYTNFSQFLIMWSGNIAEETPYYYVRNKGSWGAVALFIVVCHFFLPFMLLLWRKVKRDIRLLAMVAVAILVVRSVDLFWIVKPMFIQRTITLGPAAPENRDDAAHGARNTNVRPPHEGTAEGIHPGTAPAPAATAPATAESHPAPGGAEPAQENDPAAPAPKATDEHKDVGTVKGENHHVDVPGLLTGIHWTDIPAFAGIGGLWVAAFVWRLKQRPLLPPNDPRLAALADGGHH